MLINHVRAGAGRPPIVFIHGFGCDRTDWDAQVAHFSSMHQTIAVDLRGHGASPGAAADCSIELYANDVAVVMRALDLPPAVIVGHSMGFRVAIEAALHAPAQTRGVILIDGGQQPTAMAAILREAFTATGGYASLVTGMFKDMFTDRSDKVRATAIVDRALRLPRPIGEKMLNDMVRYDTGRLARSLASLRVPVMALQTTSRDERGARASLRQGETTPYLELLRATIPSVRVEIVEDTGHFPQLDESARTNGLLERFIAELLPAQDH